MPYLTRYAFPFSGACYVRFGQISEFTAQTPDLKRRELPVSCSPVRGPRETFTGFSVDNLLNLSLAHSQHLSHLGWFNPGNLS